MRKHLPRILLFTTIALGLIFSFFPASIQARDISGYEELILLYAKDASKKKQLEFMKIIKFAEQAAVDDILEKKLPSSMRGERMSIKRKSQDSIPTKIFEFDSKFSAIGFKKILSFRGDREPIAFMLLFEIKDIHNFKYLDTYLLWKGRGQVQQYSRITKEYLCKNFSDLGKIANCKSVSPREVAKIKKETEEPKKSEGSLLSFFSGSDSKDKKKAVKADKAKEAPIKLEPNLAPKVTALESKVATLDKGMAEFKAFKKSSHSKWDLKSGKIKAAYIDSAIARDSELKKAINQIPSSDGVVKALEKRIVELEQTVKKLAAVLQGVSRNKDTVTFSGVNVQIVNGSGGTEGPVNGLGNLIVGYNEPRGEGHKTDNSGSHNVVIGSKHNYSSFGGLVVGSSNDISGKYSSVCGGNWNKAIEDYATVSGGHLNAAKGKYSTVQGGLSESATRENSCGGCP